MKFVKKKLIEKKSFKRIEFSAVRKEDILDALKKPREINQDLVNAAMTRRFLDRFFGYKISPITKRRTIFGTSAGRVQSPALKVLCEKEKEIDVFVSREFWEISVELMDKDENKIQCSLLMDKDKKFDKFSIDNKEKAEEIRKKLRSPYSK